MEKGGEEDNEDEITGLCLKMEDLGKKEKTADREIYSHIVWADKMAMVVKGVKIEAMTTYIGHIRKELIARKGQCRTHRLDSVLTSHV